MTFLFILFKIISVKEVENITEKVLITGANGQIGTELAEALCKKYGVKNIIISDIKEPPLHTSFRCKFEKLDVIDIDRLTEIINTHKITQIYHMAAILSANAEKNPKSAWDINIGGLINVLEISKKRDMKIFYPSSIGIFGKTTPPENTPQYCAIDPCTIYGISKRSGEMLCEYYFNKFGVDVRSVRFPGLISWKTFPGGGTTDYAVEIFHQAMKGKTFECFLSENTALPMMYMPDAIRAIIELMEVPPEKIKIRTSYNLASMSFSPEKLVNEIKKYYPNLKVEYKPDFRQKIADSWPHSIDDSRARNDWGWKAEYSFEKMVADMIENLKEKYATEQC